MSILSRVKLARRAGRVTRYHGQYLQRPENIAEHTFGVMNILTIMLGTGGMSVNLLLNTLYHDGGEYISGDMLSPVKKAVPGLREVCNALEKQGTDMTIGELPPITEWEHMMLKAADNLDGLMKCIEERGMGNYTLAEGYYEYPAGVGGQYCAYLEEMLPKLGGGPAAELVQAAITEWHWGEKK